MYLSLSQSQSSLSDPIGRLESIVISQLEGIYSQIEDVFQCVKSDSNDSQVHQATDYVTNRLNLEIRKFKFSNSSKSILESSMIQFIRRVSALDVLESFVHLESFGHHFRNGISATEGYKRYNIWLVKEIFICMKSENKTCCELLQFCSIVRKNENKTKMS